MKKFLAKLVLFSFISIFINLNLFIVHADDPIPFGAEEETEVELPKGEIDTGEDDTGEDEAGAEEETTGHGSGAIDESEEGTSIENAPSLAEEDAAAAQKKFDEAAEAEQPALKELIEGIKDADSPKNQCVKDYIVDNQGNKIDGPDAGYIIIRVEEPLDISPSGTTGPDGDEYVQRRCFQNTFKYYIPHLKEERVKTTLSEICSPNGKNLTAQYGETEFKAQLSCREIMIILTKGGTTAIYGYIGMIYRWGASLVGIIAVTVIIFSGIQISASGGDSEAINAGKKRILQSLLGIIILFLSGLILYTVNPNFFVR